MFKAESTCILIVDDVQMTIDVVQSYLQETCEVLTATSGEEGMEVLLNNKDKIDLILLDIVLPQMSGFNFIKKMKSVGLSRIPVIIITSVNEQKQEVMALNIGAADFVKKPLHPKILRNRIRNVLMRYQLEYDALTGVYNRRKTFGAIREMVEHHPEKTYVFTRYDIDNFSLYNASMGEEEGDRLLMVGAEAMRKMAEDYKECVYGRLDADVFCTCEEYNRDILEKHIQLEIDIISNYRNDYRIKSSMGICVFKGTDASIESVYTKASLAARTCKGTYNKYFAYYEDWMELSLYEEQELENEMIVALEQEQFVPYLQPKYNLETDEPIGAEALVRWIHPTKGIISPGKFIPVFEKNGFIAKLDYFMWESICKLLNRWKTEGGKVYPVSVNISRISMHNPQLDQILLELIEKYDLTPDLLELEITESAYMSDPELMKNIISNLQREGFLILMDDFGSGYSSLNTLKEIRVDVLKVDMKFLPQEDTIERSEKILSSVIRMAGWLGIPTIAEGVETEKQRDFLKGIGCGYVQGYYYSRPITIQEFEEMTFANIPALMKNPSAQHSAAVWSSDEKVNEILSGIQLPVGIVEFSKTRTEFIRVNVFFGSTFGYHFKDDLLDVDRAYIRDAFATAAKVGNAESEFEYPLPSGKLKYYRMKVKRLEKAKSASLLCVIMIDITAEKTYGKQLLKLDKIIPIKNRAKMLVIEDNSMMRDMVVSFFVDKYDICEAENGKDGLEILQREQMDISIILLDVMMPVMDGKTFLMEKDKMAGTENIPVIVMSAESDKDIQLDMLAFGVNDYITKPFDTRIFKQKVENAIMYAERFVKLRKEYEHTITEEVEFRKK